MLKLTTPTYGDLNHLICACDTPVALAAINMIRNVPI